MTRATPSRRDSHRVEVDVEDAADSVCAKALICILKSIPTRGARYTFERGLASFASVDRFAA